MKWAGLDLGSSTVKLAILDNNHKIQVMIKKVHYGNVLKSASQICTQYAEELKGCKIAVTGASGNLIVDDTFLFRDIPAIQKGAMFLEKDVKSIIEIGSQNARYITDIGENHPPLFAINENCAGGTGSFFEDQMYRLGLKMENYSELTNKAQTIPRLTGRCSVFAKTDIIHRQQEGVAIEDILLGLCYATIRNYKAVIVKNLPIKKPLALAGGINNNRGVIRAVKEIFQLEDKELICREDMEYVQAFGAALLAEENHSGFSYEQISNILENKNTADSITDSLAPLELNGNVKIIDPVCRKVTQWQEVSLGIDIGSTSTNLVLTGENQELIDFLYLRTQGNPEHVVKEGLRFLKEKYGDLISIKTIGVTGSGRYLIGKMLQADVIKDEITAQGYAAAVVFSEADTVFEIGGQDSKFIQIEDGKVVDFQMNKICAAGTGSFVEEQAKRLGVELDEYGKLALQSQNPSDLGERCTVFMESSIGTCLAKGTPIEDILAGICYSVVKNYLFKVVGKRNIGNHIVLQGGVCYNPGIVAAFQSFFGDKINVSPYFSVSGAYGVALLAEQAAKVNDSDREPISFDYYRKSKDLFYGDYTRKVSGDKKVIGVPFVLVIHKFFPMIRAYFESLGYQVLLSPETGEEIIELSQKYAQVETCYPVKLIYGHMAWLAERNVDFIFLPSIMTMKHEKSNVRHNYGCMYMQTAPKLIFENMNLDKKGIKFLNPPFYLDFGKKAMVKAMVDVGLELGRTKPVCTAALIKGAMAVREHGKQTEQIGRELIDSLKPDEKVCVLVTRNYGVEDPVLNMGIPQELMSRGYKVLNLSHLEAHDLDISEEYDNMYWPFGQHIISGIKLIANHPNLYAVYITNHGCGPDTMLSHLVKQEMGKKPYLSIEVDEHYSKVGVITRIEAFLNSLDNQHQNIGKVEEQKKKVQKNQEFSIPNLYPYSQLISGWAKTKGYQIEVLPEVDKKILSLGKEKTMTKEYLSFAALAGSVLESDKMNPGSRYIIPQTEGSETDGVYARVLRNYINNDTEIIAPILEVLPFTYENTKELFNLIMIGDLLLCLPCEKRKNTLEQIIHKNLYEPDYLVELINNESYQDKAILLTGDPWILYQSYLNQNLIDEMEKKGILIQRSPLSEYLLFLWEESAENKVQKEFLYRYEEKMQTISNVLELRTPFSNMSALLDVKNRYLQGVHGGNIGYRQAKGLINVNVKAVIDMASMYENAQTIMKLSDAKPVTPILYMEFEGKNNLREKEKLNDFLYYL